MLDKLPTEILSIILSYVRIGTVTGHKDLKQVCEVCTRLRDCAIPRLYRCLVFNDPEATLKKLAAAVNSIPRRYASHIRDLELRVPIHHRTCYHEIHDDAFDPEDSLSDDSENMEHELERDIGDGIETPDDSESLVDLIHALYDLHFLDDQLQSFRWNLGMCIPDMILSSNEFSLLRKQKKVKSLILHTDVYCNRGVGSGLNKYRDFECLKDCIKVHGHQLLSLTLDLDNWDRAKDLWTDEFRRQSDEEIPDNFLVHRIMNAKVGNERTIMQSLEYLDLSAISFEHADVEMPFLFGTENLKTLKLRKCKGSLKWLELVSSSGKLTELKYFELVLTNSGPITTTKTICNFIHRAPKLQTLCLMVCKPISWETLISTVRHCSSLTRLVMHSLADERIPVLGGEAHKANQLQGLQARPSCKLLHNRATGTAMVNMHFLTHCDPLYHPFGINKFAEWAFSADGLPDLTVLAWGDFSHEGHFSQYNRIYCRSKTGYRRLNASDISLWDLVNDNMDMLAACPYTDTNDLTSYDLM
ncbi:uncharacterized protein BO87DRAFT_394392 [Aspergillus neoniger CBS 115656]|uniref:F-box domain-containing protein n=1 Tax=Aspergillus neoniger (strain CBS 115656) TaxID=1448310 RepID=A0A318ZNH4_ASPNB|nr:hypothetical protein BO87DRAFT_394392 [Aspergillus neoniger CBS 115656]PYH37412.1 hypothetical protein BO87DRAFT_394392 [Aspergillus neoniger CBS 115656]